MDTASKTVNRRKALSFAGVGMASSFAAMHADGADWTAAEKANVQVVNDFCASWPGHDVEKIMSFFADSCAYRMTEAQDPVKGRAAVADRVKLVADRAGRFEVLETFAKGPMVINERIDHFTGGPLRSWHGVGVFFLKDGKIVEWYDYTISMERG